MEPLAGIWHYPGREGQQASDYPIAVIGWERPPGASSVLMAITSDSVGAIRAVPAHEVEVVAENAALAIRIATERLGQQSSWQAPQPPVAWK
jgi:hypothetical protein